MAFDPYHKWLGILPKDRPPNYYRLLNIELFENDLDVIEGAADKQMTFVRQYQSGEHSAEAAKILNELAKARLCLLKLETKKAYDATLRHLLVVSRPKLTDPIRPPEWTSPKQAKKPLKPVVNRARQLFYRSLITKGGVAFAVLIVGTILFTTRNKPPTRNSVEPHAVAKTNPFPTTTAPPISAEPDKLTTASNKSTAELPQPTSGPTTNFVTSTVAATPVEEDRATFITDRNSNEVPSKTSELPIAPIEAESKPAQPDDSMPVTKVDSVTDPIGITSTSPSEFTQDKTGKELESAFTTYEYEKELFRRSVVELLEIRESKARNTGDKKSIDQTLVESEAFEKWNVIPHNLPAATIKRRNEARAVMENAFNNAIRTYLRSKNDDAAAITEKKLRLFRCEDWQHLNVDTANFKGDALQIGKNSSVSTKGEFSGPIEIHAIARTEKNNIRLYANRGSCVIFNWERNQRELRVCRPDGNDQPESGTIIPAPVNALKPNVWYRLRWRLAADGMTIFVNDQAIFSESKTYDLSKKSKIQIVAIDSVIEVRDFHVVALSKP